MKKFILMFAAAALLGSYSASAQDVKAKNAEVKKAKTSKQLPKVDGVGLFVENETIDYGTINQGANGAREFVITNNGTQPLIITNAIGSCGCTVPTFPKEPILPGKTAVIGVKYDTNRVGPFQKTVNITSNATSGSSKILTIKGTVNAKAAEAPKS